MNFNIAQRVEAMPDSNRMIPDPNIQLEIYRKKIQTVQRLTIEFDLQTRHADVLSKAVGTSAEAIPTPKRLTTAEFMNPNRKYKQLDRSEFMTGFTAKEGL